MCRCLRNSKYREIYLQPKISSSGKSPTGTDSAVTETATEIDQQEYVAIRANRIPWSSNSKKQHKADNQSQSKLSPAD